MDFRPTFVIGAPLDEDVLNRFWGQKVKGQGCIKFLSWWRRPAINAAVEFNFLLIFLFYVLLKQSINQLKT